MRGDLPDKLGRSFYSGSTEKGLGSLDSAPRGPAPGQTSVLLTQDMRTQVALSRLVVQRAYLGPRLGPVGPGRGGGYGAPDLHPPPKPEEGVMPIIIFPFGP